MYQLSPSDKDVVFSKQFYKSTFGMRDNQMILRSTTNRMEVAPLFFPTLEQFVDSCKTQMFSLPKPIMEYIALNPSSPAVYQKLIKSCKWFFAKNPKIVVRHLSNAYICNHVKCHGFGPCNYCTRINVDRIVSKIWVTNNICLKPLPFEGHDFLYGYPDSSNQLSKMFLKDAIHADMDHFTAYDEPISIDQLKYLAKTAKFISLHHSKVLDRDGDVMKIEEYFSIFKDVTHFEMTCSDDADVFGISTLKELLKHKQIEKLEEFKVFNAPSTIDIADLRDFIQKACLNGQIVMQIRDEMSEVFKEGFDRIVGDLIQKKIRNRLIYYGEMERYIDLLRLF